MRAKAKLYFVSSGNTLKIAAEVMAENAAQTIELVLQSVSSNPAVAAVVAELPAPAFPAPNYGPLKWIADESSGFG